jgi:hypothetical protein
MTRLLETAIPYEQQADLMSNRMCGAAALCMVYRSFDIPCSQAEVWPHIARMGASGEPTAPAHRLAADALRRGLGALVVKARDPMAILKRGLASSLRMILNHRIHFDSLGGHYTVLVDLVDDFVILHDPQLGPERRVLQYDLLKLWQPQHAGAEITGNVLVAFAQTATAPSSCATCGTMIPESIRCPSCQSQIPLHPAAALGCVQSDCPARTWELIFCPTCDAGLPDLSGSATGIVPGGGSVDLDENILDLSELSAALDKFCNALLASQPDPADSRLQTYLDEIRTKQRELREAQEREAAELQAERAAARQRAEATKPEESSSQAAKDFEPIDGAVLGQQLVRELGLQPPSAPAPKVADLPAELKPVKKEPPKPEKKAPAQLEDYELFRKAMQKPAKPANEGDFGTAKGT